MYIVQYSKKSWKKILQTNIIETLGLTKIAGFLDLLCALCVCIITLYNYVGKYLLNSFDFLKWLSSQLEVELQEY